MQTANSTKVERINAHMNGRMNVGRKGNQNVYINYVSVGGKN